MCIVSNKDIENLFSLIEEMKKVLEDTDLNHPLKPSFDLSLKSFENFINDNIAEKN